MNIGERKKERRKDFVYLYIIKSKCFTMKTNPMNKIDPIYRFLLKTIITSVHIYLIMCMLVKEKK